MEVSLLGLGSFLPPIVRTNDAWPPDVVAAWREKADFSPERASSEGALPDAEGPRRVLEAMRELAGDPFQGAVARHVMPPDMSAVDMAAIAARRALDDAGVREDEIEFVLGSSFTPDLLNSPDVCGVHAKLGLRDDCFVIPADSICNSFQMQLAIADGFLASGRYSKGLLVQAAATSRVLPMNAPYSVGFGDGASAVVVGGGERRKLVAQCFETDSTLYRALCLTVRGGNWWEEGRIFAGPLEREAAVRAFPGAPDVGRRMLHRVLDSAKLAPNDVDFFACHQASLWFRRVVQEHAGLSRAAFVDTFAEAGTISAANIPLVLDRARERGMLEPGMLVAMFQTGSGATYGASLLRW